MMNRKSSAEPLITNFQRFSVDDGPGIRTTVFFKGCNLKCPWCHNPENIPFKPSLQFFEKSCLLCGRCEKTCRQGVHSVSENGHFLNWSACISCGDCVEQCLHDAVKLTGKYHTPEAVLSVLKKDVPYYETSKGGVTFSGGEPMLFPNYLLQILKLCRYEGIHTAVDTAGCVPFSHFEKVRKQVDLFLYDVKFFEKEKHKHTVGRGNRLIQDNLRQLSEQKAQIIVRIPVIPGFNKEKDELDAMACFLASLSQPVALVLLLPYHSFGSGKYESLGLNYAMKSFTPPPEDFMQESLSLFTDKGIPARIS